MILNKNSLQVCLNHTPHSLPPPLLCLSLLFFIPILIFKRIERRQNKRSLPFFVVSFSTLFLKTLQPENNSNARQHTTTRCSTLQRFLDGARVFACFLALTLLLFLSCVALLLLLSCKIIGLFCKRAQYSRSLACWLHAHSLVLCLLVCFCTSLLRNFSLSCSHVFAFSLARLLWGGYDEQAPSIIGLFCRI